MVTIKEVVSNVGNHTSANFRIGVIIDAVSAGEVIAINADGACTLAWGAIDLHNRASSGITAACLAVRRRLKDFADANRVEKTKSMRAVIETLVSRIEQSSELLRRHL